MKSISSKIWKETKVPTFFEQYSTKNKTRGRYKSDANITGKYQIMTICR